MSPSKDPKRKSRKTYLLSIIIMVAAIALLGEAVDASRLPVPGSDNNTWGGILNDFLFNSLGQNATQAKFNLSAQINTTIINGSEISTTVNITAPEFLGRVSCTQIYNGSDSDFCSDTGGGGGGGASINGTFYLVGDYLYPIGPGRSITLNASNGTFNGTNLKVININTTKIYTPSNGDLFMELNGQNARYVFLRGSNEKLVVDDNNITTYVAPIPASDGGGDVGSSARRYNSVYVNELPGTFTTAGDCDVDLNEFMIGRNDDFSINCEFFPDRMFIVPLLYTGSQFYFNISNYAQSKINFTPSTGAADYEGNISAAWFNGNIRCENISTTTGDPCNPGGGNPSNISSNSTLLVTDGPHIWVDENVLNNSFITPLAQQADTDTHLEANGTLLENNSINIWLRELVLNNSFILPIATAANTDTHLTANGTLLRNDSTFIWVEQNILNESFILPICRNTIDATFDQAVNTTSNVTFNNASLHGDLEVQGDTTLENTTIDQNLTVDDTLHVSSIRGTGFQNLTGSFTYNSSSYEYSSSVFDQYRLTIPVINYQKVKEVYYEVSGYCKAVGAFGSWIIRIRDVTNNKILRDEYCGPAALGENFGYDNFYVKVNVTSFEAGNVIGVSFVESSGTVTLLSRYAELTYKLRT